MESQRIHILLQKYFDAQSTLEEENELITYFHSDEVDNELKPYVMMFSGLKKDAVRESSALSNDLMNYIIQSGQREKLRYRFTWQLITGVAAAVIMVMLAVNFYNHRNPWKDTFTDSKQAYAEASKTLEYVAGKYNMGLAELKPIGKIVTAVDPLHSGLSKLNKGFKKMEKMEPIKNEFKKQLP